MSAFTGGRLSVAPARQILAMPSLARISPAPIPVRGIGYGGDAAMSGTTERQTGTNSFVPAPRCAVRLYDAKSGAFVAATVSDASGIWSVPHLARREFVAMAVDPTGAFDPVASARTGS